MAHGNLTSAVDDPSSSLRCYFDRRFPHIRPIQDAYRRGAGPMLVYPGESNAGTLGAAFEYRTRFTLDPTHTDDNPARSPDLWRRPPLRAAVAEVVALAGRAAADGDADTLARASWVCALGTELYRSPRAKDGSPLREFFDRPTVTAADLLALASSDALRQLHELAAVAHEHLLPNLDGALYLGQELDGSQLYNAEVDLVSGGLLLDVKARLGGKQASGERYDNLPGSVLHQLLGYLLFDRSTGTGSTDSGCTRRGTAPSRHGTWAGSSTRWPGPRSTSPPNARRCGGSWRPKQQPAAPLSRRFSNGVDSTLLPSTAPAARTRSRPALAPAAERPEGRCALPKTGSARTRTSSEYARGRSSGDSRASPDCRPLV